MRMTNAVQLFTFICLIFFNFSLRAEPLLISHINTIWHEGDRVILQIEGVNFKSFDHVFFKVDDLSLEYEIAEHTDKKMTIKTRLAEGGYVVYMSSSKTFKEEETDFYEILVDKKNLAHQSYLSLKLRGLNR